MICRLTKIREFSAMGGPAKPVMGSDKNMRSPTRAGRYVIALIERHVSADRYGFYSALPWGTPMRLTKTGVTEVQVKGKWIPLTSVNQKWGAGVNQQATITSLIRDYYTKLGFKGFPNKWVFNDFGHNTIKYFKDINNNWRRDGKEQILGDFIHTTPWNEAETAQGEPVRLGHSHGCIHIMPLDLDTLIGSGYAKPGNSIEVHPYDDLTIPAVTTRDPARPGFEVHFFPGLDKLVIYKSETVPAAGIDSTSNGGGALLRDTIGGN